MKRVNLFLGNVEKNTVTTPTGFLRKVVVIATCLIVTIMFSACSKDDKTIPVSGVTLSPATATLTVGSTLALTATVTPDIATNKALTWSSSNTAVATVTNGTVTGLTAGTATITVTTQDGNKTATCSLTVTNPEMTMTTSKASVEVRLLGSGTATVDWGDGTSPTTHTLSSIWTNSNHTYLGSSAHTITIAGENITGLFCSNNQLTALDVNKNAVLVELWCNQNQLTTLDVNKNTASTVLYCYDNQLTALDVSKNTALTTLNCRNNSLAVLDVSKNTAMTVLNCRNNQLAATALNTLFGTLHSNTISGGKNIYISGNSGTATCDRSIATNKGWTVND